MSLDAAMAFIDEIGKSSELQNIVNALQGKGVLARMVELGAKHGFVFSEADYRAAVVEMADGALSDEALDDTLREAGFDP
jgi:hypothetical protein